MATKMIDRPVFIVGSGRSGTTLLYELLASHPQVTWFSNWTNRFPRLPYLAFLSRAYRSSAEKGYLSPAPAIEGNKIYQFCGLHGIHYEKQRSIDESDVPVVVTERFRRIIKKHQRYHNRPRFLHKNTNNSMRILYLQAIFPDAKFVHIVRDGRAVALSLLNVAFWQDLELWWSDYSPKMWSEEGREPIHLCLLHWERQVQEILKASQELSQDQYIQVRYEDLVIHPQEIVREIIAFCNLPWNPSLDSVIAMKKIRNQNQRWQSSVNKKVLNEFWLEIKDTAAVFGYT